jgi:sigma-E factor negative regulatory protein RseC
MTDALVAARARVLAINPDGGLRLEVLTGSGCEGCRGDCVSLACAPVADVRVAACPSIAVGDEIVVSVSAAALLRSALWTHGVPWVGLLLGAVAGAALGGTDLSCLLGAGVGLIGGVTLMGSRGDDVFASVSGTLRVVSPR